MVPLVLVPETLAPLPTTSHCDELLFHPTTRRLLRSGIVLATSLDPSRVMLIMDWPPVGACIRQYSEWLTVVMGLSKLAVEYPAKSGFA